MKKAEPSKEKTVPNCVIWNQRRIWGKAEDAVVGEGVRLETQDFAWAWAVQGTAA